MLAIIQIDVRVTLRIFKNHFQKLHMHFFPYGQCSKNDWLGSNSTTSQQCERKLLSDVSWVIAPKKRALGPIDQSKGRANA